MTLTSKSGVFCLLFVLLAVTLVECGVMNNESVSVSSSSSITKSKATQEAKKPSARGGKVLYTAPYSHVRVSKNEPKSLLAPGVPPKFQFRSLQGPVLIRKGEEQPSTTTSTTTTTTMPSVVLIDIVTEPDTSEEEEMRDTEDSTTQMAATTVKV
ncbi:uncharacterized protein LOC110852444 [Folsomia candida]|uniref:Uncharacterized protein n=1 Tax=Folsomia candida TaxID=158441 RepID=A0A226E4W4_FOLCA|nr:uncharacterized protein LOC110852444 [Folsomia candida]OXA51536.1 hypothetical protein Fcan01_13624 [Folsomia candida]